MSADSHPLDPKTMQEIRERLAAPDGDTAVGRFVARVLAGVPPYTVTELALCYEIKQLREDLPSLLDAFDALSKRAERLEATLDQRHAEYDKLYEMWKRDADSHADALEAASSLREQLEEARKRLNVQGENFLVLMEYAAGLRARPSFMPSHDEDVAGAVAACRASSPESTTPPSPTPATTDSVEFLRNLAATSRRQASHGASIMGRECAAIQAPILDRIADELEEAQRALAARDTIGAFERMLDSKHPEANPAVSVAIPTPPASAPARSEPTTDTRAVLKRLEEELDGAGDFLMGSVISDAIKAYDAAAEWRANDVASRASTEETNNG